MIVPSQQKRRRAIAARNQGISPVIVPMRIPVLGGSVTALELALNATNAARKAILPAIAPPTMPPVDTAGTAVDIAVTGMVGDARPIRTAIHAEDLDTWPEIAPRGRAKSATIVRTLQPGGRSAAFANRVLLQVANLGI